MNTVTNWAKDLAVVAEEARKEWGGTFDVEALSTLKNGNLFEADGNLFTLNAVKNMNATYYRINVISHPLLVK